MTYDPICFSLGMIAGAFCAFIGSAVGLWIYAISSGRPKNTVRL